MANQTSVLNHAADNIRILAASMVEKAKSGHPGGAMGGADFINVLYSEFLQYDPCNPKWEGRDRFFLDPGHMAPMLYSQLALIGKFSLEELKQLWKDEKLRFYGHSQKYRNHYAFQELLDTCYATEWVPYCKKTFNGAQSVIDYLGKYTHRIAISNHRIIRMDEKTVTFFVKDYHNKGHWKEFTLSGVEFIRRFLMHVPPKRYVRIRHYGLLCSRTKNKKLTLCRNLLGCQKYLSKLREMEMPEILDHLYGIKICVCKSCGGHLSKPQRHLPLRC